MKKLYIVKAGTSFPATLQKFGDFDQWTKVALGQTALPIEVIDVEDMTTLPPAAECAGVAVTGSHAMVTDKLEWSVRLEDWIVELVDCQIPFFGICYGHQLLGSAIGGTVGYHPHGKEIGTMLIRRRPSAADDPLFDALPDEFWAHTTHSQSVLQLPVGALLLAENDFEPCHAFRIGPCAWGVQFHPEYDAAIMRSYIEEQAEELTAAGRQVDAILATVRDTPVAADLFRRFTRYIEGQLTN